ncbi:MAG: hypothetical protein K9J25_07910 [Bacteroidales bacterium]|nr:hypothetical protein [Bacteroidales bacterium]
MTSKRILILGLLLSLLFASCEKNNSDGINNVRITDISMEMGGSTSALKFEYNSNNLLSKFTETYRDNIVEISVEYNSDKLPVKITRATNYQGGDGMEIIEWTESGFNFGRYNYILDSENKLSSIIDLELSSETQVYDTVKVIEYIWTGNESLKRVCTYYPPLSQWNDDWEDNYSFGEGISPFKGINIALLVTGQIEWAEELEEHQNDKCTSYFSNKYLSADITYEFNEYNYPTKATAKYNDGLTDYFYFEYEEY